MKNLTLLVFLPLLAACSPAKKDAPALNIYIWTNYLPAAVVQDFEKETGIHVTVDTYDSNEALLAKLQSGVADYDLVVPSDYLMKILIPGGLVQTLDLARLPHRKNLDPRFTDQKYDPGNRHSVPYTWGTTGLGYAKKLGVVDSWSALFGPRHSGRILMLDDVREVFGTVLKQMGRSINETDPAVLRQAAARLKAQKKLVKTYNSSDFANFLEAGDVDLAMGYNGEIAKVVAAHPDRLAYVVPKEGGTVWIDNLAIPQAARHREAAHRFIDFVLRPEIAARIVNETHYAMANRAAWEQIDAKIRNDPAIYPPKEVLDRCELVEDLGDVTQLYDELWTEVKAE